VIALVLMTMCHELHVVLQEVSQSAIFSHQQFQTLTADASKSVCNCRL